MIPLHQFINHLLWPSEQIFEMATITKDIKWGNDHFRVAVHGTAAGDREVPHIHIYLSSDKKPYECSQLAFNPCDDITSHNKFNFEISLVDILCYDEVNLIFQRDEKTGKRISNRNKCSWEGYKKIADGFEDWLEQKPTTPGDFRTNLEAIIYWWNEESDSSSDNPLKDWIESRGLKVLDKYKDIIL